MRAVTDADDDDNAGCHITTTTAIYRQWNRHQSYWKHNTISDTPSSNLF